MSKLTGQYSFDFIETKQGELYAIECNPRTTSGIHLIAQDPNLAKAIIEENAVCISPAIGTKKQLAFGMLLYGWRKKKLISFLKEYFTYQDVLYCRKDLKPFLT